MSCFSLTLLTFSISKSEVRISMRIFCMTGVCPFRERDPCAILPGVRTCFNLYFSFGSQMMVFSRLWVFFFPSTNYCLQVQSRHLCYGVSITNFRPQFEFKALSTFREVYCAWPCHLPESNSSWNDSSTLKHYQTWNPVVFFLSLFT